MAMGRVCAWEDNPSHNEALGKSEELGKSKN